MRCCCLKKSGCQILKIAQYLTLLLRLLCKVCWNDDCWDAVFICGRSDHRKAWGRLLGS
jgi:hypothetical protein